MKIIIIGGGIAGLSAATLLCDIPNIEIVIYEKESQLGGQASSMYTKNCNIEYSWRIFGYSYDNLKHILFNILKLQNKFINITNSCFIENDKINNASLNWYNQIYQMLKTMSYENYHKLTDILCICYDRIMECYDINAYEYSDKNDVFHAICGPFLGMDAKKVSLSGIYKNACSFIHNSKNDSYITKQPTNDAIFNDWETYLNKKGVKIHKSTVVSNVVLENNLIKCITVNKDIVHADEYIFSSSLQFVNKLFENKYKSNTLDNMKKIEKDLQLYFTINLYFSKKIKDKTCEQSVILDSSWQPIIQRKLVWDQNVLNKCSINNKKIKEVWNVGFIDYNPGTFNGKILRECSLDEAIIEGIKQVKNNKYIQQIFNNQGITFDEVFIGYEHWYQFQNDVNGKLICVNPKFSINVNTMKNMPNCHENDLPKNMTLSGYYVNNTMGGVSMEASCETGLTAGKYIIDKYKLQSPYNNILPIQHTHKYLTYSTYPFILIDKLLFYFNLPSFINYINSFYVLLIYFILIVVISVYILYKIYKYILLSKNIKLYYYFDRLIPKGLQFFKL